MSTYISGGCKNGKSHIAQRLALSCPSPLYYIATMDPGDEEDEARILRHRANRAGLGFRTVEKPRDILSCLTYLHPEGTFLIDSVTALLANEMFPAADVCNIEAPEKIASDLIAFVERAPNTVLVSDYIQSDAMIFDKWTDSFREGLALVDRQVAEHCDDLLEVVGGVAIAHEHVLDAAPPLAGPHLITGGMNQGKLAYAMNQYRFANTDVFTCAEDRGEIDFSKRAIDRLERFTLGCLHKNDDPIEYLEATRDQWKNRILIVSDITDGLAPGNVSSRAWRVTTGRMLTYLASEAETDTRLFLGRAQRIK